MAELLEISNTVAEFIDLARSQLAGGDAISAEQTARAVISLDCKSSGGWHMLGEILSQQPGRRGEASHAFAKALELDPKNSDALGGQKILSARETAAPMKAMFADGASILPHLAAMSGKDQLIADARSAETSAHYHEAKRAWEAVLELDPSDTWAWSQYGHLLSVHLHQYGDAEAAFRRAIEEDPTDDWAFGKLGIMIADFQGRVREGQALLREAIRLDPSEPYYHGWLGWSLYRQSENLGDAEAELLEATRLQSDYQWAYFHLGYVRYVMGTKPRQARKDLLRAVELDPSDVAALYNLAALFDEQLDAPQKAEAYFLKVVALDPDHAASHFRLAMLFERDPALYGKAQFHYQQILSCYPKDLTALRCLASLYCEKMARFDDARALYEEALRVAPNDADLHYKFGCMLWYDLGKNDLGISHLEQATILAPDVELGWASLGEALEATGSDYDGAEKCYLKALDLSPEYYWVHTHYGALLYRHLAKPDDARRHLLRAIEINSSYAWGWQQLAKFYCVIDKNFDLAHSAYLRAIEVDSEDGTALFDLVEMNLGQRSRPDLVSAEAALLCERYPESGYAWSLRAIVARFQGESRTIVEDYYKKATDADPENHWCWHVRADYMLYNLGEMGEAEEMLLTSMKYETRCTSTVADLGLIRLAQGEQDIARALFEKALEDDDQSDECWRLYGRFLFLIGDDPALIEESFDRAIEYGPYDFENRLFLAVFLESQQDRAAEAASIWEKARALAPKGFDLAQWADLQMRPLILRHILPQKPTAQMALF